jgi:hypothetical protein
MSDTDLATALHRKFYADMPPEQFNTLMGVSAPAPAPPPPRVQAPVAPPRKDQALGFAVGAFKPLDNAALALETGLNRLGVDTDAVNRTFGTPSSSQAIQGRKAYVAQQARKGVVPGGVGRFAGEVVGTLPIALATKNPIVAGALGGAALTDKRDAPGVLTDAGLGAIGGKIGDSAFKALTNTLAPRVQPAVQKLLGEGVKLTPGQIMGGAAKWTEDRAMSAPFIGDMIRNARQQSLDTFNVAAINRALKPLNMSLPENVPIGHDAVAHVQDTLNGAYQKLLPTLKVDLDTPLVKGLADVQKAAQGRLLPEQYKQFQNIVRSEVLQRFRQGGLNGENFKAVDSELGGMIRRFGQSASGGDQELANALKGVQGELRAMIDRQNVEAAPTLKAINQGWAALTRLENAASRPGAVNGVFSPSQLAAATRAGDSTARKRASAAGGAMMQDLAHAAQEVLPSKIPDSGTAGRTLFNLASGGGLLAGAKLGLINPLAVAGAGLTAIPYTRIGRAAAEKALTARPGEVRAAGELLRKLPLGIPAAATGAVLVTAPRRKERTR